MRLKNFEEFLNEADINVLNSYDKFLSSILENARRKKLLQYVQHWEKKAVLRNGDSFPVNNKNYVVKDIYYQQFFLDGKICYPMIIRSNGNTLDNIEIVLNPATILILSEEKMNVENLKEIFPETITASFKNQRYKFTRSVLEDGSQEHIIHSSDWYSAAFQYVMETEEGESVTFDMAKGTETFKNLLESYPLEIISSPKQIKNGSIILAIPSKYIIDPGGKFTGRNAKYLNEGYAITKSGYIRKYPINGGRAGIIGKFDPSTLKGWDEAFDNVEKSMKKFKRKIESSGDVKMLTDSSEREKYRGMIAAHSFGI